MNIKLTNTLTGTKEIFEPLTPGKVNLYVCGVTPYDYSHIGHGRCYVTFDTLVRLLRLIGFQVTYVRNVTDIDDKLLNKAQALGDMMKYTEVAEKFTQAFHHNMAQLNCLTPDYEPRVTQCIPEIIEFINGLIQANKAYVVDNDVYFDLASYPAYGKLSGKNLDDLIAGARVDVDERKRSPGDFALWKGNNEEKFWKSPWGYGRPGWHIECSVMAKKYLGTTVDIHGGGQDLTFPHHENERAQSESLHNEPFVRFWMHNAFVNINKEKMSKSLGNIISLNDMFKAKDPMVVRFYFLQHHYRTPIDFSYSDLDATQTAYKKLVTHLSPPLQTPASVEWTAYIKHNPAAHAMLEALCDDLNTPKFLGLVFEHLSEYKTDPILADFVRMLLTSVLGLTLQPLPEQVVEVTPEIQKLLYEREEARLAKNWKHADAIRDQLTKLGYTPQDKKVS
jgi:cysteinyl-tRNA synthetase